jgi:hypothetical protein
MNCKFYESVCTCICEHLLHIVSIILEAFYFLQPLIRHSMKCTKFSLVDTPIPLILPYLMASMALLEVTLRNNYKYPFFLSFDGKDCSFVIYPIFFLHHTL